MAGAFSWVRRLFTRLTEDDKRLAASIANITGRTPGNLDLYKLAVRHSSFNSGANGEHNERLEFLGDAVLGAVVAEYLFKKFPKKNEGFMTEIRSRLVNGESLGQLATKIGLDRLIQYEGRRKMPHTHRSMNGDAMEALVGAFYLDTDFDTCRTFILERLLKPHYDLNEVVESDYNHKSRMIEWAQKAGKKLSFDIAPDSGRGNKDFVANVMLDGKMFASGSGFSKKKAEQAAALAAIKKIKERSERNRDDDNRPDRRERPSRGQERHQERGERNADRRQEGRPERTERPEGQPRPERQPRADRPGRFERPPRPAQVDDQESAPQNMEAPAEQPTEQRPARPERTQRTGRRIDQAQMYDEAAPIATPESNSIESTEPRPERPQRERPNRRERPPRRGKGDQSVEGEALQAQPEASSAGFEAEASAPAYQATDAGQAATFAQEPTAPQAPVEKPQANFQVNQQKVQPKAVEEVAQAAQTPQAPPASGKRKWINVSQGAAQSAQPQDAAGSYAPIQPKSVDAPAEGADAQDMARQAYKAIASEADAFLTAQMPADSPAPPATGQPDEQDGATPA